MKICKKLVAVLLCTVFVAMASIGAQAYTIDFWYAYDHHDDGSWTIQDEIATFKGQTIKFSEKKGNKNNDFEFFASNEYAKDQWKPALGISMTNVVLMDSANLKMYGGTMEELKKMGLKVPNGVNGVTWYGENRTKAGTANFGGRTKTIYNHGITKIAIVDWNRDNAGVRKTCLHEMGHALGWYGHSKNSADVMYYAGSTVQYLTANEKRHLKQVY